MILTKIFVFKPEYTYKHESIYTIIKKYVTYNYKSMNTRVYLQL